MPLLEVANLRAYFHTRNGIVRAVDGVSFSVEKGETLGIVGESGSGKSVTCYSLMGLIPKPPGRIESGTARFDGADLLAMKEAELNKIRGKRIAMIFQDPMTSLNPYLRIEEQLIEPLLIHEKMPRAEAVKRAIRALEEALETFAGCAVIISHDRWFLDRIATHVLAFEGDSQVRWFEGNFSEYESWRKKEIGSAADQPHRIKYKPLAR